jgi:ABC-type sugar transport system ATPase subunit
MNEATRRELDRLQITIRSVSANCTELSGGQRQAIAVARAVAFGSRVVLMDEPTAALGVQQQENVGRLIKQVRDSGMGVVLISHNLPQVHELCDRVVVLLHGRTVADLSPERSSIEETISWITGAALAGRADDAIV